MAELRHLLWKASGSEARLEIAHVKIDGSTLRARGTQIGAVYELRYVLGPDELELEIAGRKRLSVSLGDADSFDLGLSPLFNSLPVLRDDLLRSAPPRDYTMLWVSVPDLGVERSRQRYEPLGNNTLRFSSGAFAADLVFDDAGFVVDYPGLATRVY